MNGTSGPSAITAGMTDRHPCQSGVPAPTEQNMSVPAPQAVSADDFRAAMAQVATPVSVVTAFNSGRPYGTTVSAFLSLSLRPPMVLISLDNGSNLLAILEVGGSLGLNVLGATQNDLASRFATKCQNKFDGTEWHLSNGTPRLENSHSWISGTILQILPAGDHRLVLISVETTEPGQGMPLTFWRGTFGTHATS